MIAERYRDFWGNESEVPAATLDALRSALGDDTDDWGRVLPPVLVLIAAQSEFSIPVTLPAADHAQPFGIRLAREDGSIVRRTSDPAARRLLETRTLGGRLYERRLIPLDADIPLGYHTVRVKRATMRLIVAPPDCYLPPALADGARIWGLAVQLYSVRSDRNWGIGDFADLRSLARTARQLGAAAIGLNPLHVLHLANPAACSPYAPSSRLFLNPLYLDIESIPDFATCRPAQGLFARPEFQACLAQLRSGTLVDYPAVAASKRAIVEELFNHFESAHLLWRGKQSMRARAFRAFIRGASPPLKLLAIFQTISEHLAATSGFTGWHEWPEEYRDPLGSTVGAFAEANRRRVTFFMYLQWLAELQLADAATATAELPLGLYRDLAIGVDHNSADAWADRELLLDSFSIGAPPDSFTPAGQRWGLAPMNPRVLRERGYEPFVQLLRANMRCAGALRIDHVMGLTRQFLVPRDRTAADGAYVTYPAADLLAVLALESQRNRCAIVGEDLGVVPEGLRERMQAANILGSRVLYFEREAGGAFRRPLDYPPLALASAGTHDLPTVRGYWFGRDAQLRLEHGLISIPSHERELAERQHDRVALLAELVREGCLTAVDSQQLVDPELTAESGEPLDALVAALYGYLARTPAGIVMVALEDVAGELEQPNLPGTFDSHPNWRRRLGRSLEDLASAELATKIAAAMNVRSR